MTRDWQPIADMRLSDKDENGALTMNTHLHVLEAYTTLYKACHMSAVEKQLRGLIDIFVERLYNPLTGHIDLFFDEHWHGKRNIASYGHDIEASWLLTEAADVLGDGELKERLLPIIRHIAQASIEGIQTDGSMIHERKDGRDDKERQWWVMCEQVIGFLNQWQLFGDETDRQRAEAAYQYILTNLIDTADGEWYWAIHADGTIDRDNDKAGFWKCPYHNSRMCLNIMDRTLRTDSQCRS